MLDTIKKYINIIGIGLLVITNVIIGILFLNFIKGWKNTGSEKVREQVKKMKVINKEITKKIEVKKAEQKSIEQDRLDRLAKAETLFRR